MLDSHPLPVRYYFSLDNFLKLSRKSESSLETYSESSLEEDYHKEEETHKEIIFGLV